MKVNQLNNDISYRQLTVSPGGTDGTEAFSADAMPAHFKMMLPVMMPMMKMMGQFHDVDVGAKRYVDAVLGENSMAAFKSGTFVGSKKGVSGRVMDQSKMKKARKYREVSKQEAAFNAVCTFS